MEEKNTRTASQQKTLYDSGYGEIFLKNFLAGLGYGLGALVIHLIFFIASIVIVTYYVLPQLEPFISSLTAVTESFKNLSEPKQLNLQQFLGQ